MNVWGWGMRIDTISYYPGLDPLLTRVSGHLISLLHDSVPCLLLPCPDNRDIKDLCGAAGGRISASPYWALIQTGPS